MKRLVICLFAAGLLSACQTDSTPAARRAPAAKPDPQALVAAVRAAGEHGVELEVAPLRAQLDAIVRGRLAQLERNGHAIDKVDVVVQGGTFPARDAAYQDWFIAGIYAGLNDGPGEVTDGWDGEGDWRAMPESARREHLADALALAADVLRNPAFPESEFEQLRTQAITGMEASRFEPGAIAGRALAHACFARERLESDRAERQREQRVLLETVAAAPACHHLRLQRPRIEAHGASHLNLEVLERNGVDVCAVQRAERRRPIDPGRADRQQLNEDENRERRMQQTGVGNQKIEGLCGGAEKRGQQNPP